MILSSHSLMQGRSCEAHRAMQSFEEEEKQATG